MATGGRVYRVRITGATEAVRRYLVAHPTEANLVRPENGQVTLDTDVAEALIAALPGLGLRIEVLYDAEARAREPMRDVGKGDRFEGGRIPRGLGLRR